MKHKSKICFHDLHFILLDRKLDVERFLEIIVWSLLNNSKQTNTLADPDVGSLNSMKKNFN